MRIEKIIRSVAPVIAVAAAASMAGCSKSETRMDGEKGVPLAELDLSGDAPDEIVLAAPDKVIVRQGERFTIDVEGDEDARDRLRFSLDGGKLGIMRQSTDWRDSDTATINVILPSLRKVTLAGSGDLHSEMPNGPGEATIAGSGKLDLRNLVVEKLDVTIAGSGSFAASGGAKKLDLTIAGSGNANMGRLEAGDAKVEIAGSGNAEFMSDGTVDARIMGSGVVTVRGNARCKVKSMGSGEVVCEGRDPPPEAA